MNVSTKSEYGLRALIYLASHEDRDAIPAREIATEWSVPVKYLEQILKTLKEAGILNDRREGRWVYYSLNPDALEFLEQFLGTLKERSRTPSGVRKCCD